MNTMPRAILLFGCLALIAHSPASDSPSLAHWPQGVKLRFSDETITAIKDAKDCVGIPLKERPPQPKYDKATKKMLVEPVLRWLEARAKNGKPLSESSYKTLADLLLNPANHYGGLYCVGDVPVMAIRITIPDQAGYIVLNECGLIVVIWDNTSQSALLNDTGRIALQQWISAHLDEPPPSSEANGQRYPPGTEIKNPYTKRIWVVQVDGSVKPETDLPHIKGTLTLQREHLIFSADGATETFDLAKAPGIEAIKYTKKLATKDEKEVDVSEAFIEIADGVRLTLVSSKAVRVVKVADEGYVRWTLTNK